MPGFRISDDESDVRDVSQSADARSLGPQRATGQDAAERLAGAYAGCDLSSEMLQA